MLITHNNIINLLSKKVYYFKGYVEVSNYIILSQLDLFRNWALLCSPHFIFYNNFETKIEKAIIRITFLFGK